jgi:hypothetical protein
MGHKVTAPLYIALGIIENKQGDMKMTLRPMASVTEGRRAVLEQGGIKAA